MDNVRNGLMSSAENGQFTFGSNQNNKSISNINIMSMQGQQQPYLQNNNTNINTNATVNSYPNTHINYALNNNNNSQQYNQLH